MSTHVSDVFTGRLPVTWRFPGDSVVKNPSVNTGDTYLISGLERYPGEGNGNLL